MIDWDELDRVGSSRSNAAQADRDAESESARWPQEAEDEDAPLAGVFKGEARMPSQDGGTYPVLLIEDRDGERWRVSKSASIRREFSAQGGGPRIGDGIYLRVIGKDSFRRADGETIRYNVMSATILRASGEAPPSPPPGKRRPVKKIEEPDDDLPF